MSTPRRRLRNEALLLVAVALGLVAALAAIPSSATAAYGPPPQAIASWWPSTWALATGATSVSQASNDARRAIAAAQMISGALPTFGTGAPGTLGSISLQSGTLSIGYRIGSSLNKWFNVSSTSHGDTSAHVYGTYTARAQQWCFYPSTSSGIVPAGCTGNGITWSTISARHGAGVWYLRTRLTPGTEAAQWTGLATSPAMIALKDALQNEATVGTFVDEDLGTGNHIYYRWATHDEFMAALNVTPVVAYTNQPVNVINSAWGNFGQQPAWGGGMQTAISAALTTPAASAPTELEIGQIIDPSWDGPITDEVLLNQFVPEYRLSVQEQYRPSSAALATDARDTVEPIDHLHTNVLRFDGTPIAAADPDMTTPSLDQLSLEYLASAPAGTYIDEWPQGTDGSASLSDYLSMLERFPGVYDRHVYGRVVNDAGFPGEKILQYWTYYYFNPKTFYTFGDHEGDWELVQVRLDASGAPVSATYAAHGDPSRCQWADVQTSGSHPIVWVAEGSHAAYFWPGVHLIPDGQGTQDRTGDANDYLQDPLMVENVTTPPGWMTWDGRWGDIFHYTSGPKSPGKQDSWNAFAWEPSSWSESCTPPSPLSPAPRQLTISPKSAAALASTRTTGPVLPAFTAQLQAGQALVKYCWPSLPADPHERPWLLWVTLDNKKDRFPPVTRSWDVKKRCGTVVHSPGPVRPPYVLHLSVRTRFGERSAVATRPLRASAR